MSKHRYHEKRNFGYAVYYKTSRDPKWKMHPQVQTTRRAAEGLAELLEWDPARPYGRDPRFESKIVPLSEPEYDAWVEKAGYGSRVNAEVGWREVDRPPERRVVK